MTLTEYMNEINDFVSESEKSIEKYDTLLNTLCNEYTEFIENARTKVALESGTDEDMKFYEDKAEETTGAKIKKAANGVITAILNAIKKILEGIKNLVTGDRIKKAKEIANDPSMKNKKLSAFDVAEIDKAENELNHVISTEISKAKKGNGSAENIDKATANYRSRVKKAMLIAVPITTVAAIGIVESRHKHASQAYSDVSNYDTTDDIKDPLDGTTRAVMNKVYSSAGIAKLNIAKTSSEVTSKILGLFTGKKPVSVKTDFEKNIKESTDDIDVLIKESEEDVKNQKNIEYLNALEDALFS